MHSLSNLNSIQRIIFSLGLVGSLLLGTQEVIAGVLTAGDIVLLQSLMMQVRSTWTYYRNSYSRLCSCWGSCTAIGLSPFSISEDYSKSSKKVRGGIFIRSL
jgi:ABC-type bacteriocin/lantibiotic exporter with double-glycine peptidase domain